MVFLGKLKIMSWTRFCTSKTVLKAFHPTGCWISSILADVCYNSTEFWRIKWRFKKKITEMVTALQVETHSWFQLNHIKIHLKTSQVQTGSRLLLKWFQSKRIKKKKKKILIHKSTQYITFYIHYLRLHWVHFQHSLALTLPSWWFLWELVT